MGESCTKTFFLCSGYEYLKDIIAIALLDSKYPVNPQVVHLNGEVLLVLPTTIGLNLKHLQGTPTFQTQYCLRKKAPVREMVRSCLGSNTFIYSTQNHCI